MILVAVSYANNILNLKVAESEFSTNKQFMQTTGQQLDDIAWTPGRTQTVSFLSKFGTVKFQEMALNYTFRIQYHNGTWKDLTMTGQTGIILYNMPVSHYSIGNNTFFRLPLSANDSFLLTESTAPISQVLCEEKPMSDGSYATIALVPTMRMLTSTIMTQNYFKFYLPSLESGTNLYRSQSITMTGNGTSKLTLSNVDQVTISVSFPTDTTALGFDPSFFNFKSTTITLNDSSTPKIPNNSIIEFYIGKVIVAIGQV